MKKVVVANRLVRDGEEYEGGTDIDVSPAEARVLISEGKARPYIEPDPPAAKADPVKSGAKEGK